MHIHICMYVLGEGRDGSKACVLGTIPQPPGQKPKAVTEAAPASAPAMDSDDVDDDVAVRVQLNVNWKKQWTLNYINLSIQPPTLPTPIPAFQSLCTHHFAFAEAVERAEAEAPAQSSRMQRRRR